MESMQAALNQVIHPLVTRENKPRTSGITMVIDKGLGIEQTKDLIGLAGEYIDFIKIAFGTAMLYPPGRLAEKIELARRADIHIYPGGTLFEIAVLENKAEDFIKHLVDLGFTAVEVSEGTIDLSLSVRLKLIKLAKSLGLCVLSEIGKKDPLSKLDLNFLPRQVELDLEAGSSYVIIEGRDSGIGVGVYDANGDICQQSVERIIAGVKYLGNLIWEAPQVKQQQKWLVKLGSRVNLGNVQPEDIISLEATRRALRGDTLRLYVENNGSGQAGNVAQTL
jgi:phosphosulfolactate synthase